LNSDDQSIETAHQYRFTFYPEGGSSGGELILSYKGQRAKIKVNPLTGKVATEFLNREAS
jgi:general secretion pathway protein H